MTFQPKMKPALQRIEDRAERLSRQQYGQDIPNAEDAGEWGETKAVMLGEAVDAATANGRALTLMRNIQDACTAFLDLAENDAAHLHEEATQLVCGLIQDFAGQAQDPQDMYKEAHDGEASGLGSDLYQ